MGSTRRPRRLALLALGGLLLASCASTGDGAAPATTGVERPSTSATATSTPTTGAAPTTTAPSTTTVPDPGTARVRPAWLGTRVLPIDPDTGVGEIQPTPPELVDRRLDTPDHLPPPTDDAFVADVGPVPTDVLARSTWTEACPVSADDLRYVTLPFVGFDGDLHTGELLVNADAVDAVVAGFRTLFERRFPIEEMRITSPADLDAPPTGDGNDTSALSCRPSVGSTSWSQHAYGRAVDVNPFHNPYVKGDLVLPELASAYVDRDDLRPGMLTADDVAGFVAAGWVWGGSWSSLKDHMHLSASGR